MTDTRFPSDSPFTGLYSDDRPSPKPSTIFREESEEDYAAAVAHRVERMRERLDPQGTTLVNDPTAGAGQLRQTVIMIHRKLYALDMDDNDAACVESLCEVALRYDEEEPGTLVVVKSIRSLAWKPMQLPGWMLPVGDRVTLAQLEELCGNTLAPEPLTSAEEVLMTREAPNRKISKESAQRIRDAVDAYHNSSGRTDNVVPLKPKG